MTTIAELGAFLARETTAAAAPMVATRPPLDVAAINGVPETGN